MMTHHQGKDMNENNAAQAAEQEIDAIMEQAQVFASAWSFLGGPFDNGSGLEQTERERANLRALLSKLRAPVADERELHAAAKAFYNATVADTTVRITTKSAEKRDTVVSAGERLRAALTSAPVAEMWTTGDDDLDMALNMAGVPGDGALAQVEAVERLKARLASAPVAGEAKRTEWQEALRVAELPPVDEALSNFANDCSQDNAVGLVQAILDAAPQASEAVRDVNALMAAEYQQWIDWFHKGRDYDSFLKECVLNKTQADKDGGDCAKGAGDVALPPLGNSPGGGLYHTHKEIKDYARAAVLADRQQRAGDANAQLLKAARRAVLALAAASARDLAFKRDYDELSAALSAQPGAQRTGGSDA